MEIEYGMDGDIWLRGYRQGMNEHFASPFRLNLTQHFRDVVRQELSNHSAQNSTGITIPSQPKDNGDKDE